MRVLLRVCFPVLALSFLAGCPGPEEPCVEAQPCTPAAFEACKAYATACTGDVSSCVVKGDLSDGTSCGVGVVCSGGACLAACEEAAACTPAAPAPCKVYGLTCNATHTGGTCLATGNVPEGTTCGSGLVCASGECTNVSPVLHTITGTISGALIANVELTLSGAASATTRSLADGTYSFPDLSDGAYVVTPSARGATFSPVSAPVTLAGADATANFTSALAQLTLFPASGWPTAIVAGGDGNLWVSDTAGYSNKILKFTPAGEFTVFTIPATDVVGIAQLAPVPGGIVFAEARAGKIGVMHYDGTYFEWQRSKTWVNPIGIAPDAYGDLWVSEANYGNFPSERMDRVARYSNWTSPSTPATVVDYAMSFGGYFPGYMASAAPSSDRLYFTIGGRGAVAWIDRDGHAAMKEWDLTGFTTDIVAGPNGSMWFTEPFSVGAITIGTTAGNSTVTHYPIPSVNPEPNGITIGDDGNVWFAETRAGKLGRLDPTTGVITEYPLPGAHPIKITRGPGGLWFTTQEYQVGRFIP